MKKLKIKCVCCGRETEVEATKATKKLAKMKWICEDCYELALHIKEVKKWDVKNAKKKQKR